MDVDKSLDDMISDKRKPSGGGRGRGGPRTSLPRRDNAVPYARPPPRSTEDKWVHDAYRGPGAGRAPRRDMSGGAGGAIPVAGTGAGFTGASPRIEVVGLHYEVTPADLKNIFSQAGTLVQGPTIKYDRSGRSTGQATMEYASAQQAKIAINKFDGAMTKGQTISIRLLPPILARPPPQAASKDLLSRISGGTGGSLASRISGGSNGAPSNGAPRGAPRGRGNRGRGGAGGARGGRRGPANEGDLDKELDSFMKTDAAGDVNM